MRIRIFAAIMASMTLTPSQAGAESPLKAKKVIEWGWDEPDTRFIRENILKMEEMPFDGLVFHVLGDAGESFVWEMWSPRTFELSQFKNAVSDLDATRFTRFTDRFLRVNVTPGNVDWFDDVAWRSVITNFKLAARLAKQGGCNGFMFDVEQYNDQLFDYRAQKNFSNKSFAEYTAMVRQRGKEWISAVNAEFPDITIMLTYGYTLAGSAPSRRSVLPYGLLASFLDGVLDGATDATAIIDGWEGAYTYRQKEQFQLAHDAITLMQPAWSAEPDKYQRHVRAGFGIWLDAYWRRIGWHADDLSLNYFMPAQFEASVREALEISDTYVWIYTEQPRWWTEEKLPKAYVDALRNAQQPKQ